MRIKKNSIEKFVKKIDGKNEIVFVVVLFLFQQEICGRKTKRETRKNFLSMKNNRFGSL